MSPRNTILVTGEIYHIYNRSVHKMPIFVGKRECDLFLESALYYLQPKPPTKFSTYRTCRDKFKLDLTDKIVSVIADSLMPNHFHFVLKQEKDNGIQQFIQRLCNSYAHYFNIKNDKTGPLFERNFKVVRVETNEQLIHLTRYVHLNSVTSYLVNRPEDYKYSSYRHYIGLENNPLIDSSIVMDQFSSIEKYKEFVTSRIDYQRSLKEIEHLILE